MVRNRKGFTLFEILTVIVLSAIMLAVALPRMNVSKRSASMAAARTEVESYLNLARAIAIRNGGKTQLVQAGNTMYIQADTGTGYIEVVKPTKFNKTNNVTVDGTVGTITFDSRGLATGLNAAGEKFYITGESVYGTAVKDSICITRFGALLDRSCTQAVAATTSTTTTTGTTTTGTTTTGTTTTTGGTTIGGVVGGVTTTVGGIVP